MLIFRGKLVPSEQALVPADDHGLLYGAGGFETFRTYGWKPFLLDRHLARLRETLDSLCIDNLDTLLMASEDRLMAAVRELLAAHGRVDAVFRYTVSAGPAGHHLPKGAYAQPWDMLTVRDLPPSPPVSGVALRLLKTPRDSGEAQPRGKSLAYANSLIAWREKQSHKGVDEGLMLSTDGFVCEGVTCNIFWIQNGALYTPAVETGLLPGVHRAYLLELAESLGMSVQEGAYDWQALLRAEAILTINAATGPREVGTLLDREGRCAWRANAIAPAACKRLVSAYRESLPQV